MVHPLKRLAHQLVNEAHPEHTRLRKGLVTKHPDGRTIKIVAGQFWGTHGLSNFWYWREVLSAGNLSARKEKGYGWVRSE